MSGWSRLAVFLLLVGVGGSVTWLLLPPNGWEPSLRLWITAQGYYWPPWGGIGVRLGVAGAVGLGMALLVWLLVRAFKRPAPMDLEGDEARQLLAALQHPDAAVRRQAAEALGHRGQEEAVAPLLEMLQASTGQERRVVAEALYKIGRVLTATVTQARRSGGGKEGL